MKRVLGCGLCAVLFAFAVGCKGGGGGDMSVEDMCKKLGEMATKEGGEALEMYNSRLKDDCVKDLGEEKTKMGDEAWKKFVSCVNGKDTLSAAMTECEPGK